jgi:DNA-binding NtrC family response regulator
MKAPIYQTLPPLLLVEDDHMVAETLHAMLEDDYATTKTATAAAALEHLSNQPPPTIILLDCLLPNGGVPAILAAADALAMPVVLISGDPRQANAFGQSRVFLSKPFSRPSLLAMLRAAST